MSDQQHRPVPGPRPGPVPDPAPRPADTRAPAAAVPADTAGRFAGLAGRPVAEHVGVFEAELERLQAELSTIDQL